MRPNHGLLDLAAGPRTRGKVKSQGAGGLDEKFRNLLGVIGKRNNF